MKKYNVRIKSTAKKYLLKMDKFKSARIINWIEKNLVSCENPYFCGKPLKGVHSNKWRYRVGAYRLIAQINEDTITIEIIDIGHKSEVYEKLKYQT